MGNNVYLNSIASAMFVNGVNAAKATATKKTQADVKKTQEFKDARKQARVDSMIWATQIKAVKDANLGAADEDVENAVMAMGYNKPETEAETVERLQAEFLAADQQTKVNEYAAQIEYMSNSLEEAQRYADADAAIQTPTPSYTTRTYYSNRDQYEAHRSITRENFERKRGASLEERCDLNKNAFSQHLDVLARRFKR